MEIALHLVLALSMAMIVLQAVRTRQNGLNVYLLLACTIGALVLPPMRNDYSLAILPGPVAIFVLSLENAAWHRDKIPLRKGISIGVILVLLSAYASILFPSEFNPHTLWLQNNSPALLAILLAVVALYLSAPMPSNVAT